MDPLCDPRNILCISVTTKNDKILLVYKGKTDHWSKCMGCHEQVECALVASFVHNRARSGCPPVISEDMKDRVDVNVCENRRFTIYELHADFSSVS